MTELVKSAVSRVESNYIVEFSGHSPTHNPHTVDRIAHTDVKVRHRQVAFNPQHILQRETNDRRMVPFELEQAPGMLVFIELMAIVDPTWEAVQHYQGSREEKE